MAKKSVKRKDGRIACQCILGREKQQKAVKTVYGATQKEADKAEGSEARDAEGAST